MKTLFRSFADVSFCSIVLRENCVGSRTEKYLIKLKINSWVGFINNNYL